MVAPVLVARPIMTIGIAAGAVVKHHADVLMGNIINPS